MSNDSAWKVFLAMGLPIALVVLFLSGWSGRVGFAPPTTYLESNPTDCIASK